MHSKDFKAKQSECDHYRLDVDDKLRCKDCNKILYDMWIDDKIDTKILYQLIRRLYDKLEMLSK